MHVLGSKKYIHDGLSLEYRAAHGALGDTLSIAEIASLTADPENMAKRMIAAWLAYVRRTEPLPECDAGSETPASVELGLKAEIHDGRMLQVFMKSPSLTDSDALREFAHHAGYGQFLLVKRDDMRAFLEDIGEWPIPDDWSLAGWWPQLLVEPPTQPPPIVEPNLTPTLPPKTDPTPNQDGPGASEEKLNALDRLLLRTHLALRSDKKPKPQAKEIWGALKSHDEEKVIQEKTADHIHLCDRDTGRHQILTYHTIETLLGPIRKRVK